ncbi:uncharacterized protein [Asterias amurensis]|uniref:uncharacterized protein isoform X1 n=1 Tax=Asterias amurensis TaxID=7602 RepID=UPI003AB5976C
MSQEQTEASQSEEDDKPSQMLSSSVYTTSATSEISDDASETSETTCLMGSNLLLLGSGRKRRKRTIITADQLEKMENLYKQEQWPGRDKKEVLAKDIGMSSHFVNIWFQNKRSRMKKLAQEEEELEVLRQTRSPVKAINLSLKADTVAPKPVNIAPRPQTSGNTSLNVSPMPGQLQIPRMSGVPVGSCFVVGQNVKISNGAGGTSTGLVVSATAGGSLPTVVKMQTGANVKNARVRVKAANPVASSTRRQPRLHSSVYPRNIQATCTRYQTQSPRQPVNRHLNFFNCLAAMMAIEEGGLIRKGDPDFDVAVNTALYGMRIAHGNILTYRKNEGLRIHNDQP